jgi:enediyne biosynthesis protein E4
VRADGSYASSNDPRLLFGLGAAGEPAALTVVWPDGDREELPAEAVTTGAYVELVQGERRSTAARP